MLLSRNKNHNIPLQPPVLLYKSRVQRGQNYTGMFPWCCPFLSSPLLSLLSLFSPYLGDDTKWPTRDDVSLNPNTINYTASVSKNWYEPEHLISVSQPTGIQLVVCFCPSLPVVLFDTPGISRVSTRCFCWVPCLLHDRLSLWCIRCPQCVVDKLKTTTWTEEIYGPSCSKRR